MKLIIQPMAFDFFRTIQMVYQDYMRFGNREYVSLMTI